jgi:hypothetical protein
MKNAEERLPRKHEEHEESFSCDDLRGLRAFVAVGRLL